MNIFKHIPRFKQVQIPYVGALYDLSGRVFHFISIANFLLVTRVYYYNPGDTLLQDTFGSYILFMIACGLFGVVLAGLVYVVIVPSHNKYSQEQSVIDGRSPTFEKICELEKKIDQLQKKLEDNR